MADNIKTLQDLEKKARRSGDKKTANKIRGILKDKGRDTIDNETVQRFANIRFANPGNPNGYNPHGPN